MKIGYARVSTDEQDLALQIDALTEAGCQQIFTDHGISGSEFQRPGLENALTELSINDTLVVWRLDRLGRSLGKLVELISHLGHREINFHSLSESINTDSAGGMLVFHMMAALAEFEQRLISERTRAGIAAARARGRHIGRKPALTAAQRSLAITMLETNPISEVARTFGVHPRTVRRLQIQSQSNTQSSVSTRSAP